MMDIMGVVSAILLLVGSVFALIGSIGIVRMPDVLRDCTRRGSPTRLVLRACFLVWP